MRSSYSAGMRNSPSPSPDQQSQRPTSSMGNANGLRFSHGNKMGLPNENIMRMSQSSQESPRVMNLGNGGHMTGLGRGSNLRPSSEMLPVGQHGTPETDVIDKWFEDLQNYEATLEEMAAASLDQNFKEELSAIEQWFRVLSEAERTAALYSLLQESTQVQIRFFITVLQQMARNDPVGAFISPNPSNQSLNDQLEAKMAQLGIKSPTAMKSPSTNTRAFQRQSTGFLSPNSASLYGSANPDVSAALAAQRSKLKANRTSAPGILPMESMTSYHGNSGLENVQEKLRTNTGNAHERPHSSDVSRSPRASGSIEDALSPISVGGSWASMVNTPIMSMLDNNNNSRSDDTNAKLEATAAQLAQLSHHMSATQAETPDSARMARGSSAPSNTTRGSAGDQAAGHANLMNTPAKLGNSPPFNIPAMSPNALAGLQSPSGGMSNPANLQMMNTMAAMGGLNNMNSAQLLALQQQILQQQQQLNMAGFGAQGMRGVGRSSHRNFGGLQSPPMAPRNLAGSPQPSSHVSGAQAEEEVADISILNDVPAWLRHLRLHKYTPNFEGSNWREMVMMDDRALEEKGVAALGARRKMLKTFEAVRQKYGIDPPVNPQPASTASEGKASEMSSEPNA